MIADPLARATRLPGLALAVLLAACTAAPETRYLAAETGGVGAERSQGTVVALDDITNGLDDGSRPFGFTTTESTAGAFFDDGASGDVRARAENLFESPAPAAERMMVRTAELAIEVPRTDDAVGACEELAAEYGGYVSRRDGPSVLCRVPAAQFESFVDAVKAMGRVLHEAMQALDVTEQHRDLSIRLDNAKKSRERLLALLEKAEKVEDLLKIENELRRLTEEIERMTAELENLESRVALSSVTVTFRAVKSPDQPTPVRRRPSRFQWINVIGAENVLRSF